MRISNKKFILITDPKRLAEWNDLGQIRFSLNAGQRR